MTGRLRNLVPPVFGSMSAMGFSCVVYWSGLKKQKCGVRRQAIARRRFGHGRSTPGKVRRSQTRRYKYSGGCRRCASPEANYR